MTTARRDQIEAIVRLLPRGSTDQARVQKMYLTAVQEIAPELMPGPVDHPYANHIQAGPVAFADLLRRLDGLEDPRQELEIAEIVDAIAEIIERFAPTPEVMVAMRSRLASKSDLVLGVASRALALGGDQEFLAYQQHLLASESLGVVRTASTLIGFGRYRAAVPPLCHQLRPDKLAIAAPIIWALGEIGSAEALPTLHAMLVERVLSIDVIAALGRIGDRSSVPLILEVLGFGSVGEREVAARALGLIALYNSGSFGEQDLDSIGKKLLLSTIDEDQSRTARYYALVAYAYLGGSLPENRVLKALGASLPEHALDPMAAFHMRRPGGVQ